MQSATAPSSPAAIWVGPCLAWPFLLHKCLMISQSFYLAFVAGVCVDNLAQESQPPASPHFYTPSPAPSPAPRYPVRAVALTTSCFELDTTGEGSGFGQAAPPHPPPLLCRHLLRSAYAPPPL